jgi:ParB family transcriptional regulator, chromosome partitioning protein
MTKSFSPSSLHRVRIVPGQSKDSLRVIDLPLASCRVDPNQPRKTFDESALKELASSIDRYGLLQPITVRRDPKNKEGFIVVAGERRFRAFQMLSKETIPAVVSSGNADEIALIENLQRENLNPIEEAEGLERLRKKYGYTMKEIGQALGKAESTISHLLKITDLPRKIKEELATSQVTRSFLIELAKLEDKQVQMKLWDDAKAGGMTIQELRRRKRTARGEPEHLASETQRLVSNAKRLVSELERISQDSSGMDSDKYEELLEVYQRFVKFLDDEAARQKNKS